MKLLSVEDFNNVSGSGVVTFVAKQIFKGIINIGCEHPDCQ